MEMTEEDCGGGGGGGAGSGCKGCARAPLSRSEDDATGRSPAMLSSIASVDGEEDAAAAAEEDDIKGILRCCSREADS